MDTFEAILQEGMASGDYDLNITEFSKELLGLDLFTSQSAVLKAFYQIPFTTEEQEWLNKIISEDKTTYKPDRHYKELVIESGMRSSKCVSYFSLLVNPQMGLIYPKEIISQENFKEVTKVTPGLHIQTRHGYKPVVASVARPPEAVKYITSHYGYKLGGSLIHPVLTMNKQGKHEWKKLKDIKTGDYICIERTPHNFREETNIVSYRGREVDPIDLGYLLGILVGDGYCKPSDYVELTTDDKEIEDFYNITCEKIFTRKTHTRFKNTTRMISLRGKDNRKWLESLGLTYTLAQEKSVPKYIRHNNKKVIAAFIRGLFDTDGTVGNDTVSFTTTSEVLAREVQVLLLGFGIISSKTLYTTSYIKQNGEHATCWKVTLFSGELTKFSSEIGFGLTRKQKLLDKLAVRYIKSEGKTVDTIPNLSSFIKEIKKIEGSSKKGSGQYEKWQKIRKRASGVIKGITKSKLDEVIDYFSVIPKTEVYTEHLKSLRQSNLFYDKVVSIEDAYEHVFDLSVPSVSEFVANGVVVHNTFLASIFVAYEFWKIIKLPNPAEHFGLAKGSPIFITTMASTQTQSNDTVFGYVKARIEGSPYFKSLIDKKELFVDATRISYPRKGITIIAGHSNSASLVGKSAKLFVMDEATRFKDTNNISNAKGIYGNVGRSTLTFGSEGFKLIISSAWEEGDIMEWLYELADPNIEGQDILAFRLSTLDLNPKITRAMLEPELRKDSVAAMRDYFGTRPGTVENFFTKQAITKSIVKGRKQLIQWRPTRLTQMDRTYVGAVIDHAEQIDFPGYSYVHADPGLKSDSFGLAVGHPVRTEHGTKCVIDAVLEWKPQDKGKGEVWHVSFENVEEIVKEIHQYRNIRRLTTDHWNASSLVQRMYSYGIPTKEIAFSGQMQLHMYTIARQKLNAGLVELPEDCEKLIREMINIQLKYGRKIDHPVKNSDDTPGSKDLVDCIVAVIAACAQEDRLFQTNMSARYRPPIQSLGSTHVADLMRGNNNGRSRINRIKDDVF